GDGTFTDVSQASRIGSESGFWTGAAWADYDRDGDLDLYVSGYVRYRYDARLAGQSSQQYRAVVPFTLNPSSYPPERNLLFRNDGGTFREVARQAGVDNPTGRSLSAAWCDFDRDGWPDLYVANDISDNAMYRNLGNGRFQDISHSAWVADYRGAMGLGIGDWDNDGDFDIFVTHWIAQENALYDNQAAPLRFLDVADQVGLGQIALDFIGWGTGFFDFDNDGRLDLFVVNGSTFQRDDDTSRLVPMRNLLFWNAGKKEGFFEAGEAAGSALGVENVGRGAGFADYDGDGDLDLTVLVNGGDARLLRNDGGHEKSFLRVVLRGPRDGRGPHGSTGAAAPAAGRRHATTTFASGALVRITAGGLAQIREIGAGPSYLSGSPPGEVHFGIGEAATVDSLEIVWPSGSRQQFRDLPGTATVTIAE
ncbi:MAG: CRTAC1 family protein, partial [Acidobacteriota bacterium]